MAAGDDGRLRVRRTGRRQLLAILTVAMALGVIAHVAGVPVRLTPLVVGGCLALLTALVTGFPIDVDPRDE
jgi:heme A synthase